MKYLTKEWYWAMQHKDDHWYLIPSERAAGFSEEYFQELYLASEEKHLASQRKYSTFDPDGYVFDSEKEKLKHSKRFAVELAELKQAYSPEILDQVSDLRVLALGYATFEVIDAIERRCRQNRMLVDYAPELAHAEHEKNWSGHEPDFFKYFSFHDYRIYSVQTEGNSLTITFTNDVVCRFKDANILLCDKSLDNLIWKYDEIYPCADGYEIHILLDTPSKYTTFYDGLADLIIQCSDVEIIDP